MGVIVGLAPVIFTTASVFQHRGGYFFIFYGSVAIPDNQQNQQWPFQMP